MKNLTFILLLLFFNTLIANALNHSGLINSNEVWFASDNPHIITGNITIDNNITVIIQPGCEIYFNGNYRILIRGTLVAAGNSSTPIIFTSNQATPQKGDWRSIYFTDADPGNVLDYCFFNYGGSDYALVYVANSAGNVSISNCNFSNSASYGIRLSSATSYPSISNCSFDNCDNFPIWTFGDRVKDITGNFWFSDNTPNAIRVNAQTITTGTWQNHGVPYVMWGNMDVADLNTLTINPGNVLQFNSDARLRILGMLNAVGTPSERIVFTANQSVPTPGFWSRLYFEGADAGSILDYCDILYGGSGGAGNIDVNNSGNNVTISNCLVAHGSSYGIYNRVNSEAAISNATIQNCADYAIRTGGDRVKSIAGNMNITGNNPDAIRVDGQAITSGTWYNHNVPYVMWGNMDVTDLNTLTINPGTELQFRSNIRLRILGSLVAIGTPSDRIVFTSNQTPPTPGFWSRLYFDGADTGSVLDHCDILYAGNGGNGSIEINNSANNVTITNCLVQDGSSYGIFNRSNSETAIGNSTIQNCGNYAIYTFGDKVKSITGSMTIAGNNPNAIRVDPQTITTGTWHNHNVPYVIWNDMDVADLNTLTINPGTEVQFRPGDRMRILGTLIAVGTPTERIVFTSNQAVPTPGDWSRLLFEAADPGTILEYCDILYGGATNGNLDIYNSGTNVMINNCNIKFSSTRGVYINSGSVPTFINNTITLNTGNGIFINGASSALFGNTVSEWNEVYGNGGFQLRNGTLNTSARYVYWGTLDCNEVVNHIYDKADLNSLGVVFYTPWIDMNQTEYAMETTWTGSLSTAWNNSSNWSDSSPCEMIDVTIPNNPANQPVVDSDSDCKNLALEAGAELTIPSGINLNVNGDLVLEADVNGTASLVEFGNLSVLGQASVQYYITEDRWHYLSPPLSGVNANVFLDMYLYSYDENNDAWFNIIPIDDPLTVGEGYKVWSSATATGNISVTYNQGTLNSGTNWLPVSYTGTGWNLVGNPYPSAIDWDHGSWIKSKIDATIYVWDGTQYLSWNGSVGSLTDGVVPAMQAFFVKANATNPFLVVSNNSRLHGPDPYKSNTGVLNLLTLTVSGNGYTDMAFVNFNPMATTNFDGDFDGYKLFGINSAPQLFSYAADDNLTINVLPQLYDGLIVPLGFKAGADGEYTILASDLGTFGDHVEIYLEDLENNVMINLMEQDQYVFTASTQDLEARFNLHFSVEDIQHDQESYTEVNTAIYSFENAVYIRHHSELFNGGEVAIFSMMGQEILREKLGNSAFHKIDLQTGTGYYVVRLFTNDGVQSQKVFIK
jgi:hypothetical protein